MRLTPLHLLRLASPFVLAALYVSWLTGCAWSPKVAGIIHEDTDGVVYLEEIQNLDFQASHPTKIEQTTVGRLLGGIKVEQPFGSPVSTKPSGEPSSAVFSKKQIEFLSPLITAALSKAHSEHWVIFRSVEPGSSPPTLTAGALYAHESHVYVTLTHFRDHIEGGYALKASSTLAPSTKVVRNIFYFVPEIVGRVADILPPGAPDRPLLATLAIDVGKLSHPSSPPVQEVGPGQSTKKTKQELAGPAQQANPSELNTPAVLEAATKAYRVKLQELKETHRLLGQRMAENQVLQEDLRILRQKLAEHRALVDQLKRKEKKTR